MEEIEHRGERVRVRELARPGGWQCRLLAAGDGRAFLEYVVSVGPYKMDVLRLHELDAAELTAHEAGTLDLAALARELAERPAGERDLDRLLAQARPARREGEFVFVSVTGEPPAGLAAQATVREDEGLTLVVHRHEADAHGLAYDFVAAWITLTVHSALDAVGLTAAVATRLAGAGISCNVVAGAYHDHLLVPAERADEAVALLGSGL